MDSPLHESSPRRRWLMPVVVLVVGGAIAIWASQRDSMRTREVEREIVGLVRDVCDGKDAAAALHVPDPTVQAQVIAAIKKLCNEGDASVIAVDAAPGDVEAAGSFQGSATHVATIKMLDGRALGLRVQYGRDHKSLVILGYFVPSSAPP
jgi:hypothetical protein